VGYFVTQWQILACLVTFALGWVLARRFGTPTTNPSSDTERLERLQDNFIATVSHELRTPLTSINGSLALLTTGLLERQPERAERMLRIAAANADRLARLVDDVLDVERLAAGGAALDLQACSPQAIVNAAIAAVQGAAEQRGVTIGVDCSAPAGVRLQADPMRLEQALSGLLDNAVKFSPRGGHVRVSIAATDKDVRLSVRDRGLGIPADKLETIFERFQQLDTSDARKTGGTGLGLAISKRIIEAHGGLIQAFSDGPGTGATLSVTLPR
jgi:signal transduction histidine kinase